MLCIETVIVLFYLIHWYVFDKHYHSLTWEKMFQVKDHPSF